MKKNLFLTTALVATLTLNAQQPTWTLDKAHAKLGFSVTHLMVSDVEGQFKVFDISLKATKSDFTDAVIELTAQVNSINTDNEKRDEHLKSPDFFDAAKYATLDFKSTSFTKVADKMYKLKGNLTMHGVTKPVELDVKFNGIVVHPYTKKNITGFKVTGTIKRTDFAIGGSMPEAVLSDEIAIVANAEFGQE